MAEAHAIGEALVEAEQQAPPDNAEAPLPFVDLALLAYGW